MNVYENLCWYDSRNQNYIQDSEFGYIEPRRPECSCDNCFYGMDRLAREIIRLRDELAELDQ